MHNRSENEKMNVNKAVAMRICQLLNEKNMTQYRLAENSGISHSRLGCIMKEKNKTVTLSTVMLLAQGFEMTLIEFLDSPFFDMEKLVIE